MDGKMFSKILFLLSSKKLISFTGGIAHHSPDLKIKQHEVLIGCNSADSGPLIEYLLHHNNNNSPSGQEIKTNLGRKHFHEKKKEREKKTLFMMR